MVKRYQYIGIIQRHDSRPAALLGSYEHVATPIPGGAYNHFDSRRTAFSPILISLECDDQLTPTVGHLGRCGDARACTRIY
jgi:hypothetical protein